MLKQEKLQFFGYDPMNREMNPSDFFVLLASRIQREKKLSDDVTTADRLSLLFFFVRFLF